MKIQSWSGLLTARAAPRRGQALRRLLHVALMLLPAGLLLVGALRSGVSGNPQFLLFLGTAFQILLVCLSVRSLHGWRQSTTPSLLLLYLVGLGWLWIGRGLTDLDDWYLHLVQALLLVASLLVFAVQVLLDSGAPEWRRAHTLARRLAARTDWPEDLGKCRLLPEVKALREAVHIDASPALALLADPRPPVRVAALAALEFRKYWRPGEAEAVLQVARLAHEPALRAGAVSALANVDDRTMIEQLAEFLRDSAVEVRRAAGEALLWDSENRWPWIRLIVRRALADSHYPLEGTFLPSGQLLTPDAVKDLTAWAAEKGFLAVRAALTLGTHYARALADEPDDLLMQSLKRQTADAHAPAALRIELAQVLRRNDLLDAALLVRLLDPVNPAPLRLIAADILLETGDHVGAVAALRDVARLPNREIALATAAIVQRRLGVDLGLPTGQPAPPLHSRQAAEVTRRVMKWTADLSPSEPAARGEALRH